MTDRSEPGDEIHRTECPICGRESVARFAPFCSARCADIDLGRWLTDAYVIPVHDDEDEDSGVDPAGQGDGA